METHDFETVFLKKYIELSSLEKDEMKDLFSNEEEFNQIKFTLSSIQSNINSITANESPSEKTKNRLDYLYHQTYQNKGILWYNSIGTFFVSSEKKWYNQNFTRIAAIIVVIFAVYPFLNNSSFENKTQLSTNDELKTEKPIQKDKVLVIVQAKDKTGNKTILIAENVIKNKIEPDFIDELQSSGIESDLFENKSSAAFIHPDGIFVASDESKLEESSFSSFAIESNPDFLDLLTPTF